MSGVLLTRLRLRRLFCILVRVLMVRRLMLTLIAGLVARRRLIWWLRFGRRVVGRSRAVRRLLCLRLLIRRRVVLIPGRLECGWRRPSSLKFSIGALKSLISIRLVYLAAAIAVTPLVASSVSRCAVSSDCAGVCIVVDGAIVGLVSDEAAVAAVVYCAAV